jgi:hypothetical protein
MVDLEEDRSTGTVKHDIETQDLKAERVFKVIWLT